MNRYNIKINNFTRSELKRIAQLHAEGISKGFISTLGIRFLEIFYSSIQSLPGGILIACYNENRITGFVSGTTGADSIYKSLIFKHPFALALVLLKSMFSIKKIKRIIETVKYSSSSDKSDRTIPAAELISLAVDPEHRRKGIAGILCSSLENEFIRLGFNKYKIMVGSILTDSQKFYESIGAVKQKVISVHSGEKSLIYIKSITSS